MDETTPGLLYRLTVIHHDGSEILDPMIFTTERRMRQAVKTWEGRANRNPGTITLIKEGCARGPWVSLDGPVEPKPEVIVFYEAA